MGPSFSFAGADPGMWPNHFEPVQNLLRFYIATQYQDGIVRAVIAAVKLVGIFQLNGFDVADVGTNGWPLVRVHLIRKIRKMVPYIAIGFIETGLFEFLYDNFFGYRVFLVSLSLSMRLASSQRPTSMFSAGSTS